MDPYFLKGIACGMVAALIIFIAMYAGMLIFQKLRVWFALGAAACMVIFGVLPPDQVLSAVNWNVIMMISGMMALVTLFIDTGMPSRMADLLVKKVPDACRAIVLLCVFSGVISAFVDNVATVLMVAPVGLAICQKMKINPVPVVIAIAVSSNLQGAATLVGDTTSILLGDYAHMNFTDFIFWRGKPSIFWAVELGALGTVFILRFIFRKHRGTIEPGPVRPVQDFVPGILMLLVIVLLIMASFLTIPVVDEIKNGLICLALGVFCVIYRCARERSTAPAKLVMKEMDYGTLAMLCGLFVVVAAIKEAGIIDAIAAWFSSFGNGNLFLLYTLLVFASVLISAFVDNIPYVAAMLPVVQGIAANLGINPVVLYFGLLSGATLGGNITPFGASANVTAIGILRREGLEVKNSDFFRIGIPFTLTAVVIGYLLIWFVWA